MLQPGNQNDGQVDAVRREIESKMEAVFSEYVGGNLLEIHFADLMVPPSAEAETERRQNIVKDLITILRSVSVDRLDASFHYILRWRSRSEAADTLVKEVTNSVLNLQILPLKNVCESLLTCQDLKIENAKIWMETFEFVDKSVSKLDYKGVRDVLKLLFDNIGNCPVHFRGDQLILHEIIEKLILRICKRNSNLLPAYFIINEIRKCYFEPKFFPHWRLAECFTEVVESFRYLGQIVTVTGRSNMVPVAAHSGFYFNSSWKLEPATLKFILKGNLPLPNDVSQPQSYLIHQALLQASYRDLLNILLSLPVKQAARCSLEEIFGFTILEVMAEAERDGRTRRHTWRMLVGVLVFLVLNALLNFSKLVKHLQQKLSTLPYRKGRDHLMWCLLQCYSAINRSEDIGCGLLDLYRVLYTGNEEFCVSETDASCVFMMAATCIWIHILEKVKDSGGSGETNIARLQMKSTDLEIPPSINTPIKFLQETLKNKSQFSTENNYIFATLCNAYSTSKETFHTDLMPVIFQQLESSRSATVPVNQVFLPGNLYVDGKCMPLKIEFLDSVTVHVRMSIAHGLLEIFDKFLQQKTPMNVSPAVVETYARLLSYTDIERYGLGQFASRLIGNAFKIANSDKQQQQQQQQQANLISPRTGACEIMFIVCEILSYRLQQITTAHRAQFIQVMQQAATFPLFNSNPQLYWMIEWTSFRQMIWFPTYEIMQAPFLKVLTGSLKEGSRGYFTESEELSKIIVITMAKAFVVSGPDGLTDEGYRNVISQLATHSWSSSTLQLFPTQLSSLYGGPMALHPNVATSLSAKQQLRQFVEQDYNMKWRTAVNDANLEHFTRTPSQKIFLWLVKLFDRFSGRKNQPNFCQVKKSKLLVSNIQTLKECPRLALVTDKNYAKFVLASELMAIEKRNLFVLCRHLVENNGDLPPVAIRILQDIGPKIIAAQLANLVDYILLELMSRSHHNLNQYIDAVCKMVWKYAIVPLDRLVLTAVLRPYDGNEALYTILVAFLLLQNEEFTSRVQECCNTIPPEYWRCSQDWFEKHSTYHQKLPEKYWTTVLADHLRITPPAAPAIMPVYFGNACLSMLPIIDLLLQRIIEVPEAHEKFFNKLIDLVGQLYKFHPQPVSFLFNTFRFYEKRLNDKVEMKQKLVYHIHNALASSRGENWLVSNNFLEYLQSLQTAPQTGVAAEWVSNMDYFAELVKRLVDCLTQPLDMPQWVRMDWRFSEFPGPQSYALHAVCVELMALPCSIKDIGTSLLEVFLRSHPSLLRKDVYKWLNALGLIFTSLPSSYGEALYDHLADALNDKELDYWVEQIFTKLDFEKQWSLVEDTFAVRLMALAHSIWLQASIGYLSVLPQKLRECLKPLVRSEAQFLYVCHLVCPFLQRLHQERSKMAMDIASDIYEMLLNVDKNTLTDLRWEDIVCDLLYHMKYMFIGDGIRNDTDRIIPQLRTSLQTKLRYISHQQLEAGGSSVPPAQM